MTWAVGNVRTGDETGIKDGSETGVAERLRELGLEVYCPRYRKAVRKWRRRRPEDIVKAVFPGYLFVNAETIRNMEDVYEVDGFHYFLRHASGNLKHVPVAAIADLRILERQGILIPTSMEALLGRFKAGDRVRVDGGPFGGMVGIVASEAKGRAMVTGGDFPFATDFPVDVLETEAR